MDDNTPVPTEWFFTESETAKFLRLSPRTLQRYRREGSGPAFVKLGTRIRYRVRYVAAWTQAHTHLVTHAKSEVCDAS